MPSFFASSKSGCVSAEGIVDSKNLRSTSLRSSYQWRGKNVVNASSGNTTNFAPMPWASRSSYTSRVVAAVRVSDRCSGPNCAAAIRKCRDIPALELSFRRPLKSRQFTQKYAAAALEAGERQRTFCNHVGRQFLVPHHQVRCFTRFDTVIGEPHHLRRPIRDHLETNAQVLRPIPLNDIGIKIGDPRQRTIPVGRKRVQHVVG